MQTLAFFVFLTFQLCFHISSVSIYNIICVVCVLHCHFLLYLCIVYILCHCASLSIYCFSTISITAKFCNVLTVYYVCDYLIVLHISNFLCYYPAATCYHLHSYQPKEKKTWLL